MDTIIAFKFLLAELFYLLSPIRSPLPLFWTDGARIWLNFAEIVLREQNIDNEFLKCCAIYKTVSCNLCKILSKNRWSSESVDHR